MRKRFIGAFLVALFSLPALFVGGIYLNVFLLAVVLISGYEISRLFTIELNYYLYCEFIIFTLLAIYFSEYALQFYILHLIFLFSYCIFKHRIILNDVLLLWMFSFVLSQAIIAVFELYDIDKLYFFYILLACFGCDIGAYFIGSFFGKHPLCREVSAKKTVEGSLGGWLVGFLLSFIFAYCFKLFEAQWLFIIVTSLTIPIIAQIGDLCFSLIKRHFGIKDYGNLIPGHGGVLDRIDSLLFCLIFYHLLEVLFK